MIEPRLRAAAVADLRSIKQFSEERFGMTAAGTYVDGLRQQINSLAERPRTGRPELEFGETMRSFSYRSHRVYYIVGDGTIEVVRILHHAQDVATKMIPPQ